MCGLVRTAPAPQLAHQEGSPPPAEEDAAVARSERSTSLATARKIQMFIKNRHLQILPGGIVNGTTDDTSEYSESNISFNSQLLGRELYLLWG